MCSIPLNLPTLSSFLMQYSLRCGSIFIFIWTLLRSLCYLTFFVLAAIVLFMIEEKMKDAQPSFKTIIVFVSYVTMIVAECFVFIGCILLGSGLHCENSIRVADFLRCRLCTMVFETLALVSLIFFHELYMLWYLGFLIVIIQELYFFIVIYSYYVDMALQEIEWEKHQMRQAYKPCPKLCAHYASLTDKREPSVSGVSQDTRDIEASQTTPDATDTPNTQTTRDLST